MKKKISMVVPVFDEETEILTSTIERLTTTFDALTEIEYEVLVVDDGSSVPVNRKDLPDQVRLIRHVENRGYGAALKTGIVDSESNWIGIVDADGTYPIEDFFALVEHMEECDMVVGARTGDVKEIPLLRRFPKTVLNWFASYLAHTKINDLNSGMRLFKRELADYVWELLPQGFSFTSTLTMGAKIGNYDVIETPIDYYRRVGKSSIHPIKDTIRFFRIVLRLGTMFSPSKIFTPVSSVLFIAGVLKGFFKDYVFLGYIGNLAVLLMLGGIQIAMMGLLAELVVQNRKLRVRQLK